MTIDRRLIERRREVAEDRARHNVGRLIKFLIAFAVIGGGVWLLLSPLLSVKGVITTGIVSSSTNGSMVDHGLVAGTPMIMVRPAEIESALEEDPWVREAVVELDWPNRVVVRVEERVPTAWVETAGGWESRAVDGVALPSTREPDDSMPKVRLPDIDDTEVRDSPAVLGALQFAAVLPDDLRSGASVRVEENGELWAEVSGFQVRLGRPVEMGAKALSLGALLLEKPEPGSILTLIAPTHPAIASPEEEETQP